MEHASPNVQLGLIIPGTDVPAEFRSDLEKTAITWLRQGDQMELNLKICPRMSMKRNSITLAK